MRPGHAALAALLIAALGAAPAWARPHGASARSDERGGAPRGKPGKPASIGAPNAGHLAGGVRLRPTRHLAPREGAHTWALPTLVNLLGRASDAVARKHKGTQRMVVGDLSARGGGPLDGHNSHQSGRDVDVGFFLVNTKGRPVQAKRFIAFDGEGRARDLDWARFDDERNWAFVEALVEDRTAHVRYVFVSNPLRARLLKYATSKHVKTEVLERAAAAMLSPDHADAHDDHFHVRISCPESTADTCQEESTLRSSPQPWAPYASGHVDPGARREAVDPQAEKPLGE